MPKMLVFYPNTSGIDRYLFPNLSRLGWEIKKIDMEYPRHLRYRHLISTFSPRINIWKRRFADKQSLYLKSPKGFKQRTRFCEKTIKNLKDDYDLIFQVSGMFAPALNGISKKYVLLLDWTRKLSEREWPNWAPVKNEKLRKEWFILERDAYNKAKLIFTVSEYAKHSLVSDYRIAPEKVVVTGYGPGLEYLPDSNSKKEYDGKTILFVGFDFKRKGGYVLLEAFKIVREKILDAKLIIVGPDKLDVNLPGVEFKGSKLDKTEIKTLYTQASIFVMPSLCEPFGIVFLEAMMYKLPCIGTDIDAMPEIITEGKTGFLIPINNSVTLATKITSLLQSNQTMKTMGEMGYQRIKRDFNWERMVDNINSKLLYQKEDTSGL